jgi:hypothetical protein
MRFSLPKPLHGWREFAGEVGIIVIGVLIALSAQAVVEHLQDGAQLRQADLRMVAEIRDDDLPQAFARAAIGVCNSNQLGQIEKAVETGDRQKIIALSSAYEPPFRTWDDEAWKAALGSQALKYGDDDRAIAWASVYVGMPLLNQWTTDEQDGLRQLRAKIGGQGALTTVQQDRLFQLLANLRGINKHMTEGSMAFLGFASKLGISVSPTVQRKIMDDAHRVYGSACVIDLPHARDRPTSAGQYRASPQSGVRA